MKKLIVLFLSTLLFCCCENKYKPDLKYPVVYVDTTMAKHARWIYPVKVIVLKDSVGDNKYIYTQRGFHDRWADSVYHNCKIGDTISH